MKKKVFYLFALFAVPFAAKAASEYTIDISILPQVGENMVEIVNLILGIFAAAFALKLAALSQGGDLEKTWNKMASAAVVFALIEIFGTLKGFGLVHLGGFDDILEFIFVLLLAITFYQTRKQLLSRALGK